MTVVHDSEVDYTETRCLRLSPFLSRISVAALGAVFLTARKRETAAVDKKRKPEMNGGGYISPPQNARNVPSEESSVVDVYCA